MGYGIAARSIQVVLYGVMFAAAIGKCSCHLEAEKIDLFAQSEREFSMEMFKSMSSAQNSSNFVVSFPPVFQFLLSLSVVCQGQSKEEINKVLRTRGMLPRDVSEYLKTVSNQKLTSISESNNIFMDDDVQGRGTKRSSKNVDQLAKEGGSLSLQSHVELHSGWASPFTATKEPVAFYLRDGSEVFVPVIMNTRPYVLKSVLSDGTTVLFLEMKDNSYKFGIVFNKARGKFVDRLTALKLNNALDSQSIVCARMLLPKLRISSHNNVTDTLLNLGMRGALKSSPNTESSSGLRVGEVLQDTNIHLTEDGIGQAASSPSADSSECNNPEIFFVNQPFVFMLLNTRTGDLVYMGKVEDPSQDIKQAL